MKFVTDPDQTWWRQASGHGEMQRLYYARYVAGFWGDSSGRVYLRSTGGCPMRAQRAHPGDAGYDG